MAQYFQSGIYSSLWSGHQAHSNGLSDPSLYPLPWGGPWGARLSFPRSVSCHHSATKAGESPAGPWGHGLGTAGSQALPAGAVLTFGITPRPPRAPSLPPPSLLTAFGRTERGSVRPCGSCPRGQRCRGAAHGAALHAGLPVADGGTGLVRACLRVGCNITFTRWVLFVFVTQMGSRS